MIEEPDEVNLCADCPEPIPVAEADTAKWRIYATVDRYDGNYSAQEILERGIKPASTQTIDGNVLSDAGVQRILDQLIGATTSPFNNTNCRLGVGNSATAATSAQTDLQAAAGSANRQFILMDATYPSRAGQLVTFKATFDGTVANFTWNEWCIDRGASNGTTVTAPMLNRKVASFGAKSNGITWTLTVTLTLA